MPRCGLLQNHEQQQQRTVKLQQEKEALEHGRRALEQEVAGLKVDMPYNCGQ
jgi:cell division protein FtsB